MDTQIVEIVGRNYLVSQLVRDGLEVARPERDRGVDLVAYMDLEEAGGGFVACPVQMKAATGRHFGLAKKYEKFGRALVFAYVWDVDDPDKVSSYALTYAEALAVAEKMGWTKTASWCQGAYVTQRPSAKLLRLLAPYKMGRGAWALKVREVAGAGGLAAAP